MKVLDSEFEKMDDLFIDDNLIEESPLSKKYKIMC